MPDPVSFDDAKRSRDMALARVATMGGGGHDGGMFDLERRLSGVENRLSGVESRLSGVENRVSGVETRVGVLESKVDALRIDMAELKGKVSQLPTIWTMMFANFGLAVTVSALVFTIARAM
jgi:hypothetical protein